MTSPTLLSPRRRGPLAETLFAAEVMARGGWFYPAIDPGDQVDCVIRSDAGVFRVQVKYRSNLFVRFQHGKDYRSEKPYTDVDVFALYHRGTWCLFPFSAVERPFYRVAAFAAHANAWHLLGLPTEKFELN